MSTRCQIGIYEKKDQDIKDFQALIYRHSDGYPSGVLPEIVPFLQWWKSGRGLTDTEYLSARLIQYIANIYDGYSLHLDSKSYCQHNYNRTNKKFTGSLGYGICQSFHWDIEYFYFIYPNGIKVFSTGYGHLRWHIDNIGGNPEKFTLLGVVELEKAQNEFNLNNIIKKIETQEV